ncbi:MAG: hypothetical protein GY871_04130 [Actinomycetales bacterium]|nr:hypothetical protein [Actinomycetales bacterium]
MKTQRKEPGMGAEGEATVNVDGEESSVNAPEAPDPGLARVCVSQGWTLPTNTKFKMRRIDVRLELPCKPTPDSVRETYEICTNWTANAIRELVGVDPESIT